MQIAKGLLDIISHHRPVSMFEKVGLTAQTAVKAIVDPQNGTHYSELTDLTSFASLHRLRQKMLLSPEGRSILDQKPRITQQIYLKAESMQAGTLGRTYFQFMRKNGLKPQQRPLVRYVPDLELAYVCQRYKQIHDFIHILVGVNVSIHEQLLVKWFEMVQLGLPSASMAALGSFALVPSISLAELAAVDKQARQYRPVIAVRFENYLHQPLEQFKRILLTPQ